MGNYPKESIQHTEHGESLKSRIIRIIVERRIRWAGRAARMSERKCTLSFQWENLRKIEYLEGVGVDDPTDDDDDRHHHHLQSNMVLGHLLTCSGLTRLRRLFNGLPCFLLPFGL